MTVTGDTTLAAGSSVSFATTAFNVSGLATGGNVTADSIVTAGIVTITNTAESINATSGALIISGGVGIAKSLHVAGNVTIGGTLRTEDKVNVDSIGIVTAGGGLYVGRTGSGSGIGITATTKGHIIAAGVVTATEYNHASGNIKGI